MSPDEIDIVQQFPFRGGEHHLGALAVRSEQLSDFLREPSIPWTAETDRNFCQYFLWEFAPLLSTTRQWHYFWHSLVPQAAWLNPAVNHAMVAVAATFESRKSGVDRTGLITQRRNLAIRAFATEPASADLGLLICRLFASIAQCQEDFKTATMHLNNGLKILQEVTRSVQARSDIVKIMAPTLLASSTDRVDDSDIAARIRCDQRPSVSILNSIRSEYGRFLHSLKPVHWSKMRPSTSGFMSLCWSTFTQALSSALYPDIIVFTADDPILPAVDVASDLRATGTLLTLAELDTDFTSVMHDLRDYFRTSYSTPPDFTDLKCRLKTCVENYVVQAAAVEPRMTAGTFWHECPIEHPHCSINTHLRDTRLSHDGIADIAPLVRQVDNPSASQVAISQGLVAEHARRKKEYYYEHVCQYRSGFMPTFL